MSSSLTKKLTTAALAGLLATSALSASAAFAGDEKASCKGKDAAASEPHKCKAPGDEKATCKAAKDTKKAHSEKAKCKTADKEAGADAKEGEAK